MTGTALRCLAMRHHIKLGGSCLPPAHTVNAFPTRLTVLRCLQNHLKLEKQAEGGPSGGRLKAIIDTVIGNLQLSITNIHIRYEVG